MYNIVMSLIPPICTLKHWLNGKFYVRYIFYHHKKKRGKILNVYQLKLKKRKNILKLLQSPSHITRAPQHHVSRLGMVQTEHFCHHRKFYWAGLACLHFSSLSRSYFLATLLREALKLQARLRMTPGGLNCLRVES